MSEPKRWFKIGCLSCLGCLGLVLVIVALFVAAAWLRARSGKLEDRVLTHETPSSATADQAPPPRATPPEAVPRQPGAIAGKVVLELEGAEFRVEPGAPGEPIRVEARYDRSSYELDESSEDAKDGTWTYHVRFRRIGSPSWFMEALSGIFSGAKPHVHVVLPREVPLALEMEIERGAMKAELGGLRLTSGTIHVTMGGLELNVSEPLAEPMERLEVKTEMGGADLHSLGNASPRALDVDFSMGGMQLDLRGAWRADADVSIKGSMGGGEVTLPTDVRIEGLKGHGPAPPDRAEVPRPTLRFSTSSEMGNVEFH